MSTAPSSSPDPKPHWFSIAGPIDTWEPLTRSLQIGERTLWVTPGVAVARLARGVMVTVTGQRVEEDLSVRWIVTQLTFA
jgi:hypothetical protein